MALGTEKAPHPARQVNARTPRSIGSISVIRSTAPARRRGWRARSIRPYLEGYFKYRSFPLRGSPRGPLPPGPSRRRDSSPSPLIERAVVPGRGAQLSEAEEARRPLKVVARNDGSKGKNTKQNVKKQLSYLPRRLAFPSSAFKGKSAVPSGSTPRRAALRQIICQLSSPLRLSSSAFSDSPTRQMIRQVGVNAPARFGV